jgi:hypothetical protein
MVYFANLRVAARESALAVVAGEDRAAHVWGSDAPLRADRIEIASRIEHQQLRDRVAGEPLRCCRGDRRDLCARERLNPPRRRAALIDERLRVDGDVHDWPLPDKEPPHELHFNSETVNGHSSSTRDGSHHSFQVMSFLLPASRLSHRSKHVPIVETGHADTHAADAEIVSLLL